MPLLGAVVYLLLVKGVIKLPPERQMRFDEFISRKKTLMLTLTYGLILVSMVLIARDLFIS